MSVILIEEKTFIKLARTMLDWDSLRSKDNEGKYYEVYKTLRKTNRTELIDKVYKLHVQNTKIRLLCYICHTKIKRWK